MNLNIHTYIWKLQKRVNQRKGRIDCYRDKIRRRWARGRVECSRGGEENKQARSQQQKDGASYSPNQTFESFYFICVFVYLIIAI